MKTFKTLFCVLAVFSVSTCVLAEDSTEASTSLLGAMWTYLNSSAGITMIVGVWSWILTKIFTQKPTWETYYSQYKGLLLEAVKYAEKAIPDDSEDKSVRRANAALQYLLRVNASLEAADVAALKQALNVAHDEAAL